MATAKLVVIFPRPHDEGTFEKVYKHVHLPMVEETLKGVNRFTATRIVTSPLGQTRTYRIAEVHFSTMAALQACMATEGWAKVLEHARTISTGGPPIILICEEESYLFW
jgi:uncharacterized protein (TIGR02118 family)